MNTSLILEMAAQARGDALGVSSACGRLTFAELYERSRRFASYLRACDLPRVGLVDVNSRAIPICLFGAGAAGAAFIPINYRLPDEQLVALIERISPALLVVNPDDAGRIPPIDGIRVLTRDELLDVADGHETSEDLPFVDPEDIAVQLFTSGTTGDPKAVVLRHRHLTAYILTSVEFESAEPDEAQLVSVPPYHIAGISTVLSSAYSGRRIHYLDAFQPEGWVDAAINEQVTHAMVVPTMLKRILSVLDRRDVSLPHLRHLSYGGGPMPIDVIEHAMATLTAVDFVNAYGLTETSSTIAVLGPDDHRAAAASDDPGVRGRLASVGRPLPSIEVDIRDPFGDPVPAGESGEIHVRGEQVAGEYIGKNLLTDDGWFPTNDAGHLDQDGFLYLEGRLDDVIVRGAENLSPAEIEEVLQAHPDVAEAAVVGVPDPEWGEAVAAVVVLHERGSVDAAAIQNWVRSRLRSTKTPDVVAFRDELPHNETGKLLRRVLRSELALSRNRS